LGRSAGFTLVEVLMVMVIVGVTAAVILPRVRFDNARVISAIRAVDLAIAVAQRDAVSRQHNTLVVFDTVNSQLRVVWDANSNGRADAGEKARITAMPEQVRFARPSAVPRVTSSIDTPGSGLVNPLGPQVVMQRSGSADRRLTMYLTTVRSMREMTLTPEVRAVQILRASGRSSWLTWDGRVWRRGR
jgi:prepilin-type N-terminal cleavage/methylation domain-containing protein